VVGDLKTVTILIVDDDSDIRNLLMIDFRKKGFRILMSEGGHAAYEILKHESVDVLITDVKMPDGDGIELLERTKALGPDGPAVILLTAFSDLSASDALARGADAVFPKPFDRKALMVTILEMIERRAE
jgi:DNA-binding response OmpR family regulator